MVNPLFAELIGSEAAGKPTTLRSDQWPDRHRTGQLASPGAPNLGVQAQQDDGQHEVPHRTDAWLHPEVNRRDTRSSGACQASEALAAETPSLIAWSWDLETSSQVSSSANTFETINASSRSRKPI